MLICSSNICVFYDVMISDIYIYIHMNIVTFQLGLLWHVTRHDDTWCHWWCDAMSLVGLEIADGLGIAFAWMQLTCCGGHRFAMPAKMHQTSGCKPSPTRDVAVQILNLAHRFSIPCELLDAMSGENVMPCENFFQRPPNKHGQRNAAGFQSSCYSVFWSNICFPSSLRKTF